MSALTCFQKVLSLSPDTVPDVRMSIGYCFHQLDRIPQARAAYTRALERVRKSIQLNARFFKNPANVDCLVALAIIDWNASTSPSCDEKDRETHRQNSDVRLSKAHSLDPTNHVLATTIADRLFRRQDYEKALAVAEFVIQKSDDKACVAEAYSIKGLIQQFEKRYSDALKSFEAAVGEKSSSLVVQYGIGQMHTFQGNYEKAVDSFKRILEKQPNNYETLKVQSFDTLILSVLDRYIPIKKAPAIRLLAASTSFGRCYAHTKRKT